MSSLVLLPFAVLLVAPASWQPPPAQPSAAAVVQAWLACIECRDGELDAVRKVGAQALATLSPALIDGPPAARLQAHQKYLAKSYADMKAYAKTNPSVGGLPDEAQFVQRETAKFVNLHRERAAIALGEIGGPQAAATLDQALKLNPPLDPIVLEAVKEARAKIK